MKKINLISRNKLNPLFKTEQFNFNVDNKFTQVKLDTSNSIPTTYDEADYVNSSSELDKLFEDEFFNVYAQNTGGLHLLDAIDECYVRYYEATNLDKENTEPLGTALINMIYYLHGIKDYIKVLIEKQKQSNKPVETINLTELMAKLTQKEGLQFKDTQLSILANPTRKDITMAQQLCICSLSYEIYSTLHTINPEYTKDVDIPQHFEAVKNALVFFLEKNRDNPERFNDICKIIELGFNTITSTLVDYYQVDTLLNQKSYLINLAFKDKNKVIKSSKAYTIYTRTHKDKEYQCCNNSFGKLILEAMFKHVTQNKDVDDLDKFCFNYIPAQSDFNPEDGLMNNGPAIQTCDIKRYFNSFDLTEFKLPMFWDIIVGSYTNLNSDKTIKAIINAYIAHARHNFPNQPLLLRCLFSRFIGETVSSYIVNSTKFHIKHTHGKDIYYINRLMDDTHVITLNTIEGRRLGKLIIETIKNEIKTAGFILKIPLVPNEQKIVLAPEEDDYTIMTANSKLYINCCLEVEY